MKFTNLDEANDAISRLSAEVEILKGIQAGQTAILAALIGKHHDYVQLQLYLTTVIEIIDNGKYGLLLSKMCAKVRKALFLPCRSLLAACMSACALTDLNSRVSPRYKTFQILRRVVVTVVQRPALLAAPLPLRQLQIAVAIVAARRRT